MQWLRENYQLPYRELRERLGCSMDWIAKTLKKMGLGRTREQISANIKKISDEDVKWLRENYTLPNSQIAKKLNVTPNTVSLYLRTLGIRKTREEINACMRAARFNKKYPYTVDAADKNGTICRYIVLRPGLRQKYIHYLMIQAGREIPNARAVPIDGNYFNFDLSNWRFEWRDSRTKRPYRVVEKAKPKAKQKAKAAPKPVAFQPEKKKPRQYATKVVDRANMVSVRVDARTWIEVPKGSCIESAKAAYMKRMDILSKKIKQYA